MAALAIAFSGLLTLSSCKGEGKRDNAPDTINDTSDTVPDEGMSSQPMGDTIVERDGDTIVTMEGKTPNQNPTGEQVP